MAGILSWILGIAWRTTLLYIGYICVKHIIRNGSGTLREILETTGLAIRAGCIELRKKLVDHLKKEEDVIELNPDEPEVEVEGTVR